jgi:CDP-diacylglycerol--serine O-phosphatidyltransferase
MIKRNLPNILTLANLGSGVLAIIAMFQGQFDLILWFLGASLVFDFLDGFTARVLGVHSEMGLQLDSLADMVSFGLAPGLALFLIFRDVPTVGLEPFADFLPYLALLIPLFSALRLAKFNIDERQTDYFIGLNTPANAILIYSICLWATGTDNATTEAILLHPLFLSALSIVSSLLLIAELPMMSLKVKSWTWKENQSRILLVLAIMLLFVFLRSRALAFVIPLYLLFSLFFKPTKEA